MRYAVLPCYNAADTLPALLAGLRAVVPASRTICIDDGSEDATARLAAESGAIGLSHAANSGKGSSLRTGYRHALALGASEILTLDSDLQHAPGDAPHLFALSEHYDLVIGSRRKAFAPTLFNASLMPLPRRLSNRITSGIVSGLTGFSILDSQCGYRLVNRACLETVLPLCAETGFMFETEFLLHASRRGFKIGFAEIAVRYGNEKSYIRPFSDTMKFLKLVGSHFLFPRR